MTSMFELIRTKREIRQFQERPVPDAVIEEILEAGRHAGSSKNTQPWEFVTITRKDTLKALSLTGDYAGHLAGAALGVALVNRVPPPSGALDYDFGRCTQNMMLAAWAHGVASCVASIYHPDRARAILGIPNGYQCEWAISFGYPAERTGEPLKKGGRRPAVEIVHRETW